MRGGAGDLGKLAEKDGDGVGRFSGDASEAGMSESLGFVSFLFWGLGIVC